MLQRLWLSLGMLFASFAFCEAQELRESRIAAIRLTVAEAVLATHTQLSDRVGMPIKEMNWRSEFTDRNWTLDMKASFEKGSVEIHSSGFAWGSEGEDLLISYSGAGQIAGEPIQISGKMDWPKLSPDRLTTSFNQVVKFGEHSKWAWMLGTEVVVGALIGGGAAVVVTSVAPPLAILVGGAGAMGGASAAVSLSNTVRTMTESDQPPVPPPSPPAPTPKKEERITPQTNVLLVAIDKNGTVSGNGPDTRYFIVGKASDRAMSGSVILQ